MSVLEHEAYAEWTRYRAMSKFHARLSALSPRQPIIDKKTLSIFMAPRNTRAGILVPRAQERVAHHKVRAMDLAAQCFRSQFRIQFVPGIALEIVDLEGTRVCLALLELYVVSRPPDTWAFLANFMGRGVSLDESGNPELQETTFCYDHLVFDITP